MMIYSSQENSRLLLSKRPTTSLMRRLRVDISTSRSHMTMESITRVQNFVRFDLDGERTLHSQYVPSAVC